MNDCPRVGRTHIGVRAFINPQKDMKRPYSLQAKDITLNFVKDKYGPNERQDLGKPIMIDHMIIFDQSDYITSFQATSISIWRLI